LDLVLWVSGIACHAVWCWSSFIGHCSKLNDKEEAMGLTLKDKVVRNRLVNDALMTSFKIKAISIYKQICK
jgi:hypothetical protein